ncbi:hypothetical protein [Emticicia agri]|uniref:Right handed beta helix domain-containing protein n=1 Tax=Emticicia agri TaxID=2492393 RepID=A0A4Q5M643_9BACT|nr:hypothetical protein [Emticicia agri]RYU97463.1 hypothetical protein EWM59_01880 [Emticicia agri]
MKKNLYFLICMMLISTAAFSQAVVRITAGTNLQTAIDNAVAGTAFLIEPGGYGDITVSKRVALIGPGYFKNLGTATILNLNLASGSENSIVTGMSISQNLNIGASGVTIQRNLANIISIGFNPTIGGVYVAGVTIKQNFVQSYIAFSESTSNAYIGNNIVVGYIGISSYYNTGQIINNTIIDDLGYQPYSSSYQVFFINNIVVTTDTGNIGTNSNFTNNVITDGHFATTDASNKKITDWSTVFVGYPSNNGYTNESRYMLLNTSPAKGAGSDGTDCGAFGGSDPYVLQGFPVGPNIYQLSAPSGAAAGQTFQVQIKAKVQN